MGNVSGREGDGNGSLEDGSNQDGDGDLGMIRSTWRSDPATSGAGAGAGAGGAGSSGAAVSAESMAICNNKDNYHRDNFDPDASLPPHSPARSNSPLLFAPQVPVAPLQMFNGPSFSNQKWQNESLVVDEFSPEPGIPTIITWNYGGNNVAVEGSWDNWTSRKQLQRSGKDHSILLVLPSGIYHYKFLVDGEWRYIADLPFVADEMGQICNILDVNDYVPENPESVAEFEAPPSPDSTYSHIFPSEDDFAKEPLAVPQQLHLTVLDMEKPDVEASSSKPQHVVLNHLFIEKGWASQSLVALGMTHRFQSKYVTVVLYKPLKR